MYIQKMDTSESKLIYIDSLLTFSQTLTTKMYTNGMKYKHQIDGDNLLLECSNEILMPQFKSHKRKELSDQLEFVLSDIPTNATNYSKNEDRIIQYSESMFKMNSEYVQTLLSCDSKAYTVYYDCLDAALYNISIERSYELFFCNLLRSWKLSHTVISLFEWDGVSMNNDVRKLFAVNNVFNAEKWVDRIYRGQQYAVHFLPLWEVAEYISSGIDKEYYTKLVSSLYSAGYDGTLTFICDLLCMIGKCKVTHAYTVQNIFDNQKVMKYICNDVYSVSNVQLSKGNILTAAYITKECLCILRDIYSRNDSQRYLYRIRPSSGMIKGAKKSDSYVNMRASLSKHTYEYIQKLETSTEWFMVLIEDKVLPSKTKGMQLLTNAVVPFLCNIFMLCTGGDVKENMQIRMHELEDIDNTGAEFVLRSLCLIKYLGTLECSLPNGMDTLLMKLYDSIVKDAEIHISSIGYFDANTIERLVTKKEILPIIDTILQKIGTDKVILNFKNEVTYFIKEHFVPKLQTLVGKSHDTVDFYPLMPCTQALVPLLYRVWSLFYREIHRKEAFMVSLHLFRIIVIMESICMGASASRNGRSILPNTLVDHLVENLEAGISYSKSLLYENDKANLKDQIAKCIARIKVTEVLL